MKRLILLGAAACTLAVTTLPAAAMRLAPLTPAVTHGDSDTSLVRYFGRGYHYGWGRGHYYNWSPGYHRRWR